MVILTFLTISLIHCSLKGWENVLFELGRERVKTLTEACWATYLLWHRISTSMMKHCHDLSLLSVSSAFGQRLKHTVRTCEQTTGQSWDMIIYDEPHWAKIVSIYVCGFGNMMISDRNTRLATHLTTIREGSVFRSPVTLACAASELNSGVVWTIPVFSSMRRRLSNSGWQEW